MLQEAKENVIKGRWQQMCIDRFTWMGSFIARNAVEMQSGKTITFKKINMAVRIPYELNKKARETS